MLNQLLVFDIETVIDTDAACNLLGLPKTLSDEEIRNHLDNYHLEATKGQNAFPRQLFHKVVAISFLRAEIEQTDNGEAYHVAELRSGGSAQTSEADLIKGFFNYCARYQPRFVSFNGRSFDLPVLRYRALKYNIAAPWFYKAGDKWNNYIQRYSSHWHCDLLEVLSDYGASARIKLNEACALLNLPGKLETDGSDVAKMFDEGKIEEIRDYCETDVLNTWLAYVHLMHHRGDMEHSAAGMAIEQTLDYLNESPKEIYKEFLKSWQTKTNGVFWPEQ